MPVLLSLSRTAPSLPRFGRLLTLLLFLLSPGLLHGAPLSLQIAGEIRSAIEGAESPRVVLGREVLLNADLLPDFYRGRSYLPAWVDDFGLTAAARSMLDLLRSADAEGLCPEEYHLARLDPLAELAADYRRYGILFDAAYMARLDLLLSDAFFLYASHLMEGRVDASEVHEGWRSRPRKVDLVKLLGYALDGERLTTMLADLPPPHLV